MCIKGYELLQRGTRKDLMKEGDLLHCNAFTLFEFFSMCVWYFYKAEHSCQSKIDSYVPVHENGMISVNATGYHGRTPGGIVHKASYRVGQSLISWQQDAHRIYMK